MINLGKYILLSSFGKELGKTRQNLNLHLRNENLLGKDAIKLGANWWITKEAALLFLEWFSSNGRRVNFVKLEQTRKKVLSIDS